MRREPLGLKKPKQARDPEHMGRVAQLPCVICGRWPVEVHHCIHDRYGQRRSPDTETIPLCYDHHQLLHADKRAWREAHGPDHGYLPEVLAAIGAEPSGER